MHEPIFAPAKAAPTQALLNAVHLLALGGLPLSPRRVKPTEPRLVRKPKQKMAVVLSRGYPNIAIAKVMPALYGAVYKHKFALKRRASQRPKSVR